MKICVVGTGYVGLVAGTCFAESGNDVVCVDNVAAKVEALRQGKVPIYEPGLEELIRRNVTEGRLTFTTDLACAGAQQRGLLHRRRDAGAARRLRRPGCGARGRARHRARRWTATGWSSPRAPCRWARIAGSASRWSPIARHGFDVVSNPEFMKEGAAIEDFMKPDRVVIGAASPEAFKVMRELYEPFVRTGAPILEMDNASAEMTKYAANALLATRISFMNEIANLCERVGADVDQVRRGVGSRPAHRPSLPLPGRGLRRLVLPEGRAGGHPHRARERDALPAAQRGRGGQRRAEAPSGREGRRRVRREPGRPAVRDLGPGVQAADGRHARGAVDHGDQRAPRARRRGRGARSRGARRGADSSSANASPITASTTRRWKARTRCSSSRSGTSSGAPTSRA